MLIAALLAVSGCASATLSNRDFVAEHVVAMTDVEKRHENLRQGSMMILQSMQYEHDVEPIVEELNEMDAVYWIYIYAAHTYLANGNLDTYNEAVKQADAQIDVMEARFKEVLEEESNIPHPSPNQIPDFRGWQENKQDINL